MKLVIFRDTSFLCLLVIIAFEINFRMGSLASAIDRKSDIFPPNKTAVTEIFNEDVSVTSGQPFNSSTAKTVVTTTPLPPENSNSDTDSTKSCKCGLASYASGKIVGGTPVNENNFWPWFAALVRVDRSTKVHCGGSLISSRYILSAAHCLQPMIQVGLRNFKVRLGSNQLYSLQQRNFNETMSVENTHDKLDVPIESIALHPRYEQSFPFHFDIGVVKLSHPVNCTHRIRPICLPSGDYSENMYENQIAITTGFGRTSINGDQSRILQQIKLKLILMDKCKRNFSSLHFKAPEVLDNMLCAWGKGKDTCVGDSGGPLFLWRNKFYNETGLGRSETSSFEQIGVTSWGIGCANEYFPGVYTKVSKFLPWLNSFLI